MLLGLVGGGHDVVTVWVPVKHQHQRQLVPWHELNLLLVDDVLLGRGAHVTREDVEANHAAHEVGADVLLPGFLRSAESDLNFRRFTRGQLEHILGV
jgi:hypothetical protein